MHNGKFVFRFQDNGSEKEVELVGYEVRKTLFKYKYCPDSYFWDLLLIFQEDINGTDIGNAILNWIELGHISITMRQGYADGYIRDCVLEEWDRKISFKGVRIDPNTPNTIPNKIKLGFDYYLEMEGK